MSKFIVKTELSNIIQNKDSTFSYNEKVISMKWNTLEQPTRKEEIEEENEQPNN